MSSMIYSRDDSFLDMIEEYKNYKDTLKKYPDSLVDPCFICEFMKNEKEHEIEAVSQSEETIREYNEKKRKNKYVLLEAICKAKENGVIEKEFFNLIFENLTGEKFLSEKKTKEYRQNFFFGFIDDFFSNRGYNASSRKRKTEKNTKGYQKKSDGNIDETELLYRYYNYAVITGKISLASGSDIDNEEYIKECNGLFELLIEEENEDAFVPLYIDNRSGAGVFIVGRICFEQPEKIRKSCVITVSCFDTVDYAIYGENSQISLINATEHFYDIEKAFDYLRNHSERFYNGYKDCNYVDDVENISDKFRPFFDIGKTEPTERISTADNVRIKEEDILDQM